MKEEKTKKIITQILHLTQKLIKLVRLQTMIWKMLQLENQLHL